MKECEDAISREETIKTIKEMSNANPSYWNKCDVVDRENLIDEIIDLPSVYPKAKVGKWITWSEEIKCDGYTEYRTRCKCSECDKEHDSYFTHFIRYCSNCGAKMEEVQE